MHINYSRLDITEINKKHSELNQLILDASQRINLCNKSLVENSKNLNMLWTKLFNSNIKSILDNKYICLTKLKIISKLTLNINPLLNFSEKSKLYELDNYLNTLDNALSFYNSHLCQNIPVANIRQANEAQTMKNIVNTLTTELTQKKIIEDLKPLK